MTGVLAKKAFYASAKFLHPVNLFLSYPPCSVFGVWRPRFEFPDSLLHHKIPRDIGYQVPYHRECFHWLQKHRLVKREIPEAGHAHKLRHTVDLRRTGTAFACFTVPPDSQIVGLLCLDFVYSIEHYHPLGYFGGIVFKFTTRCVSAPYFECCYGHYFISSIICLRSLRISLSASRFTCISSPFPFEITRLKLPFLSSL